MKIYKKFLLILGCIFSISIFSWTFTINVNSVEAVEEISFYEFESQIYDILQEDDYTGVEIAENITFNGLIQALDVEPEFETYTFGTQSVDSGALTYDEVDEICEEFGYEVYQQEDGYVAYSTFELKRLIVYGNVTNTYGASKSINGYENMNVLCYPTEEAAEYAYNQLKKDSGLSVGIDTIITVEGVEDPIINEDVNVTSGTHNSWGADIIGVDPYIEYLGNVSQEVVVVVIDSGINTSHEMFEDRFLYDNDNIVGYSYYNKNSSMIGNEQNYDDLIDDGSSSRYYFEDNKGHGTHVAGIICDLTPTNVKILPIRTTDNDGSGTTLAADIALWRVYKVYANQYNNIVAINMSLGANKGDGMAESVILELNKQTDSIVKALKDDKDILTVVSAGNRNNSEYQGMNHVYESGAWLAGCENTITVTALKNDGGNIIFDSSYSHYGERVNIAAPGTDIRSAIAGGSNVYDSWNGTSMAAPHVAGVVALLCLDNRYWTGGAAGYDAEEIKTRLYDCAIEVPGKELYYGKGMLSLIGFNGDIDFTIDQTVYTYDGKYHKPSITVSGVSNHIIKYKTDSVAEYYEDVSNEVFDNVFKNATIEPLTVWFIITTTDEGKSVTYGKASLTINPRTIGITIESKQSYYGDNIATLTAALSSGSFATGETISDLNISYYTEASQTADAGEYLITATCNNTNYNATIANATYTIIAKPISVQLGNASGQYGDEFNLSNVEITADLVNGDTLSDLNLQFNIAGISTTSPVGTYEGVIDATYTNTNYQITFIKGDYTINKREITIDTYQTSIYGETVAVSNTYSMASGSVIDGDNLGVTFTIAGLDSTSDASTYDNVISFSYTNTNYQVQKGEFVYEITARPIFITIFDRQCEYGDEIDDNNTLYEITSGTIVNEDIIGVDLTVNLTDITPKDYTITGDWDNDNYYITFTNGTFSITKRSITISTHQQGEYGMDIVIDNELYEIESGSLADNDNDLQLEFTTTAINMSNVGTYPITLQSSNPYYDVTVSSAVYQIVNRKIDVVIDNKSSQYGDSTKILTHKLFYKGSSISVSKLPNFSVQLLCEVNNQSNVGDYSITGQNNQTNKYDVTFTAGTYSITKRAITIKADNQTSQYGDPLTALTYSIIYGSLADNGVEQNINVSLSTTATPTSLADRAYVITGTTSNDNYIITLVDGNYTITKRTVSIKTEQYIEYGNEIQLDNTCFEVTSGSILDGDNLNIVFTTTANIGSDMGEYVIRMSYNNPNYNVTLSYGRLTISEKIVEITIGNNTSVYGNAISLSGVECTVVTDGVDLEELQLTLSSDATTRKVVGTYDIEATSGNSRYSIIYEYPGKYEITKRPLVIDVEQGDIYGNNPELDGDIYSIYTGSIVGQDVLGLSFTTTATSTSPIGDYEISIDSYTNNNYDISLNSGNYIISARPISILLENCTFNYGESIKFDEINYTTTSVNQVVNGDDLMLNITTTSELNDQGYYNAGIHIVSATSANTNYNVSFTDGRLVISALTITVDIDSYTNTYGNRSTIQPVYEVSGTFADGEDEEVLNLEFYISNTALNATNVGEYEDSICGRWDNSNYNVVFDNGSYIIIPRDITIKTDQVIEFGQPIILNNKQYEVLEGFVVDGDDLGLIFTTEASDASTPADYEIYLNDYTNKNYTITLDSGILTICNKIIYIVVNDASSIYGEEISQITYQLKNGYELENNDTMRDLGIQVSTLAESNSPVIPQGYKIEATSNSSNYTIMFEVGVYTILPRSIEVNINDVSSVYGDALKSLTCVIDEQQLVNGDTIEDLNIQLGCEVVEGANVIDSGYDITATYSNANYNITFTNGRYMILPRDLHITTTQTGIYGENPALNNTYIVCDGSSIVDEDIVNVTFATNATNTSDVGNYNITLISQSNTNYNVILDTGSYIINPRDIVIKLINTSSVYGDELSELEYVTEDEAQLAGTDSLEDLNIVPTTDATSIAPVGKYDITATGNNNNYNISFIKGKYTVMAKALIVVINDASSYYTMPLSLLTHNLTVSKLVGSDTVDDLNIVLSTTATPNSDVVDGGYPITGTYDNNNYSITFKKGRYIILPLRVDVILDNQGSVYGDEIILDNNMYQIIQPSNAIKDNLDVILTTTATSTSNVGEYEIGVKSCNPNYNVQANKGVYNITKRSVTISLNHQEAKRFFEFKIDNKSYQVVDGEICNRDDLNLSMVTDATWYSWMGEYTLSAISNNLNYDVTILDSYVDVKVSITDMVAVVLAGILALFIFVRIIIAIVRRTQKSNQNMQTYIDWINRR